MDGSISAMVIMIEFLRENMCKKSDKIYQENFPHYRGAKLLCIKQNLGMKNKTNNIIYGVNCKPSTEDHIGQCFISYWLAIKFHGN